MTDRIQVRAVGVGLAAGLLSIALGSSHVLFVLCMYWMLGSTGVAFAFGAAVRTLLDDPGMYPRSMAAIARAAEDMERPRVVRRTAVALYLYMIGLVFCASAFATIAVVSFLFFRW
ncbi:MAG TPA: hypothetical protein VIL30_02310 [Ramlibacter sp.]|jgi:uncharacterized membrane protein